MPSSPSTSGDAAAAPVTQAQVLQRMLRVLDRLAQQQVQTSQQVSQLLEAQAQTSLQVSQLLQTAAQTQQQMVSLPQQCLERVNPAQASEGLDAPVRLFFDGADIHTSDCFSSGDEEMPAPPSPSAQASVSAAQRRNGAPQLSSERSSADAEAQAAIE